MLYRDRLYTASSERLESRLDELEAGAEESWMGEWAEIETELDARQDFGHAPACLCAECSRS